MWPEIIKRQFTHTDIHVFFKQTKTNIFWLSDCIYTKIYAKFV